MHSQTAQTQRTALAMSQSYTHSEPPAALARFQQDFANHLRDPHHVKRPKAIPMRAAQVYQELLYNNIREFLDACFPVCQKMISATRWQRLCRVYFRDWHLDSPIFTDIPKQFVVFLQAEQHSQPLPAWFAELAHYEWLELDVDIDPSAVPAGLSTANGTLKKQRQQQMGELDTGELKQLLEQNRLKPNPTLRNQHYRWSVHKLSSEHKTRKREDTFMLVYRTRDHEVRFMHINAMTSALIAHLADELNTPEVTPTQTPQGAFFERFAVAVGYPDTAQLTSFGLPLLAELVAKQVLYIEPCRQSQGNRLEPFT